MTMANNSRIEASKRSINETVRLFEGLLARPPDESQLIRPTFKFIQETVRSLITETKIMRNIFNPIDFDTEKRRWDKRMKVDFVQKLIDFVANQKQPVVGCVAAKVVAGLEPNKTNELLQSLARIAHLKLSPGPGQNHLDASRPRTFTKQLVAADTKGPSAARRQQQVQTSARSTSGTRTSGNQVKRPDEPVVTRGNEKAASSSLPISTRRTSSMSSTCSSSPIKMPSGSNQLRVEQPPMADSPPKVAPLLSSKPPATVAHLESVKQQQTRLVVSSESDINNKNLQHLKLKLKQLRTTTLNELSQMEESLEINLSKLLSKSAIIDYQLVCNT